MDSRGSNSDLNAHSTLAKPIQLVVLSGFEPELLESKSSVFKPLHYSTVFVRVLGVEPRAQDPKAWILPLYDTLIYLSQRRESNPLTDASNAPVLKTLVTSRYFYSIKKSVSLKD